MPVVTVSIYSAYNADNNLVNRLTIVNSETTNRIVLDFSVDDYNNAINAAYYLVTGGAGQVDYTVHYPQG